MNGFSVWLLLIEGGRFDRDGFNAVFGQQLDALLPRVSDPTRSASLRRIRSLNWIDYIMTAHRNAGLSNLNEREEAAHDVAVYLLVNPGQLFGGYDPTASGPLEARFTLAVRNAVRNILRTRSRRAARSPALTGDIIDARTAPIQSGADDNILDLFRDQRRQEVGDIAVRLFDRRLDGVSLRRLSQEPTFRSLGDWGVRRVIGRIRDAARDFVRLRGD